MKGLNKILEVLRKVLQTSHMHNKEQIFISYHIKIKTLPTNTNHNQTKTTLSTTRTCKNIK